MKAMFESKAPVLPKKKKNQKHPTYFRTCSLSNFPKKKKKKIIKKKRNYYFYFTNTTQHKLHNTCAQPSLTSSCSWSVTKKPITIKF